MFFLSIFLIRMIFYNIFGHIKEYTFLAIFFIKMPFEEPISLAGLVDSFTE